MVDDAGISMAYAVNLAHGYGLVSQAGRTPVEGFSNPAWVVLLAVLTKLGLFGRPSLAGLPQYVIVTKGLAIVFHELKDKPVDMVLFSGETVLCMDSGAVTMFC